ncbi:hypothetical protein GTA08_BOTSDO04380 [Neofusicoccum parvum]|uniref:Uncharacterized protein n=1 Tax=Botryosphaeria parva (strain UCR-NP2) TaxID=1287680 RepID=R1G9I6_BOTPV|nr:hypothetical protein UCRNP2_8422 [Neofusicoccum parvum UCRNP2]GME44665.1 hypothetical protein GTA08_BOTSDO04380 [Neofusicoccum parvum]
MQRSSADASQQAPRITAPSSLVASALEAGALTGSRAHVIPGAVMFSIFGFAGQHIYNFFDTRHAARPVKVLSEDEYEEMLKEKLLKVDVEIALVDESIEKLRQQNQTSGNPEK